MRAKEQRPQGTWQRHRFAALVVRTLAWIMPVAVSVAATAAASRLVHRPSGWLAVIAWWVAMSLVASIVLVLTDKAARRLLPLAALLRLSLVFPDQAPSRFRTALRTGTVHQLEARVAAVKQSGLPTDPTDAAETLLELVAALSVHDRLTRGHAERVRAYSRMIGEELRLDEADLDRLHWAGLLHDVGKLFVPTEILNKPGALTPDEFEIVKHHPEWGAELCEPLRPWLGDWVDAVGHHHERWDGCGYPSGLRARDISLAGRIVAVADAFDVMTSVRSYKTPQEPAEARAELARCAGSHFDPDVVRAFLGLSLGRLRLVMGPLSWLAQVPVLGRAPLAPAAGATVAGVLTAATLITGGLLDHHHAESNRVAADSPPAADARPQAFSPAGETGVRWLGASDDTLPTSGRQPAERPGPTSVTDSTTVDTTTTTAATPALVEPVGAVSAPTTTLAPSAAHSAGLPASTPTVPIVNSPIPAPTTLAPAPTAAPTTTAAATTTTAAPPVPTVPATAAFYLAGTGSSADNFSFATQPEPQAASERDYDGDGKPGLTIANSDLKLTLTDGHKFQNWDLMATQPMVLTGPVTLELSTTAKDFNEKNDVDYSVWLLDCAADGSDCTVIAGTTNVHVVQWNGGVKDWVQRSIPVGTIDHAVQTGRLLRLRVMFDKDDVWIAMSANRPSRLLITST